MYVNIKYQLSGKIMTLILGKSYEAVKLIK